MRGVVILVVHARAQQVGAEHLTALGLGAKAVGARKRALVGQVGAALLLIAVANAVETGQVGECLGRADDVVGGDGGVQVRQVDLDQLGTPVLQLPGGALNSGLDLGRQTLGLHKRGDDAHALALDAVVEMLGKVDGAIRLVQSYGSWPAPVSAFMASATSSTVRPKGPTWSSDEPKATTP